MTAIERHGQTARVQAGEDMNQDVASEISTRLSELQPKDMKFIPRVEHFLSNGSYVSKNFQKYIGNRILNDLSQSTPGKTLNIMMYAHASAGKTTELRKLTSLLCGLKKFKETFHPLYSELQRGEATNSPTEPLWPNILSGSILSKEEPSPPLTFEDFVDSATSMKKIPLIIIDTLDILLLDEIAGEMNMMEKWNTFLSQASNMGAAIIWTCRPYEWHSFQDKLPKKTLKRTLTIELPRLQHDKCKPFPISSNGDNERWQLWSQYLQSYMPIFASRWSVGSDSAHQLPSNFISELDSLTHAIWSAPLGPEKLILPISIYYKILWGEISQAQFDETGVTRKQTILFQKSFESQILKISNTQRTHRLRFQSETFCETLHSTLFATHSKKQVEQALEICNHLGLLKRTNDTFEFSHQLLFEEVIFTQEKNKTSNYNLPSIALRKLPSGSGKDLIQREASRARVHWTGAIFSFHPSIANAENLDWNLWIEEAYKLNLIDDTEANETSEKNIILRDYMDSTNEAALFLRGAPGTGKTYFCLNFIVEHLKNTPRKMLWRYVTLNRPLVDSVEAQWRERKDQPQNSGIISMESKGSGPLSVEEIIIGVLRESNDTSYKSIKLLDFTRFKEGLNLWFHQHGQGTTPPPAYTDAWSDFTTIFHQESGAQNTYIEDESDYFDKENRRVNGTKTQITLFTKFCFYILSSEWKTYANASFLAREQLTLSQGKTKQQYDLLMIDEVQDITPSTMALLLLLLRPKYQDKTILIAGDDLQTVNRSGFSWFEFCRITNKILIRLDDRTHPEINRLLGFGISEDVDSDLYTLKQVYRNAPKIATLNDTLRNTFADQYPTEKMPNYPREFLQISEMAEEKNIDCKISFIWAPSDEHIDQVIQSLTNNAKEISITSKTAIITPYESTYGASLNSIGNFTTYDGETVKGLEFSGVVLFNPYEMLYSDAEGNLNKGLNKGGIEERIRTWMKRDSEESKLSVKSFTQLYQNIMTRMNVLVSRPEYRLLVVSRQPFPEIPNTSQAVKINTYHGQTESIIFSLPTLSTEAIEKMDIQILDMKKESQDLDDFISSALKRESNTEGYSINNYLRWALDEAQVGNFSNEKQSWENLLEVRPEQLKKQQTTPIPNFSILLLAGAESGQPGSFIGDKIKLPTILTAFRSGYRSKKGWGVEPSTNGACEEFIIPLIENKAFMEAGTLPIEIYYALGARLEQFLNVIFKDAAVCAEHHPYILNLISKEILGLSLDERSISIDKPIIFDANLSLDANQNLNFTPPSLEETIQRCESQLVPLDPNAHILDEILLHIYRTIDDSVVEHILSPEVFNLPAKIEQRVQQITHAPAHSPLWDQMVEAYPNWETISRASSEVQTFIRGALKKQELYQTVRGLWGLDHTNTPITKHLPEETFTNLKQQRLEGRRADTVLEESRYIDGVLQEERSTGKETADEFRERKNREAALKQARRDNKQSDSKKSIVQRRTKETTIRQDEPGLLNYFEQIHQTPALYSFFDAILDLQFQDFGGEDPDLPGQRFFNSPKFWTGVVRDTIEAISTEKGMSVFEYSGRNFWNTWYYNKDTPGESLGKSPLQRFIHSTANTLKNATTWSGLDELALEVILSSKIRPKLNKNIDLTINIIRNLLKGTLSPKAINHFKSQFLDLLAGPRKELTATQAQVDKGQAKKVGDKILTGVRGGGNYRIPARLIDEELSGLFQILVLIAPHDDPEPLKKPYYNTIYASANEAAENTFSQRGDFAKEDKTKKRDLANHFHSLSLNSSEPGSTLQKIIPIAWDSENWSVWLARLLYGSLEHYFSMGGKESSLGISHQKYNFPKDSGGQFVMTHLEQYFKQHFPKTTPSRFLEVYFSMVNCGQYSPQTDKPLRTYGTAGHLTGNVSHFNISRRTGYFIGAMTNFLDILDTKPDGYTEARNTSPLSLHPAYTKTGIGGITPKDVEHIRTTRRPSKQVAGEMGLSEKVIIEIRNTINFVPFHLNDTKSKSTKHASERKDEELFRGENVRKEDTQRDTVKLKNEYSNIEQPRMSAFDISYPPYGEDNRAQWITDNLDGLAKAYDLPRGKNRKRILRHICFASANDYQTKSNTISTSSLKASLGRALAINLLNTQTEKKGRDPRFDHILDWRILYECSKIGKPKEEKTFDQFIATLESEIEQINGETLQFSQLLHNEQLADYFILLSDPTSYLFDSPETKKFNYDEFEPLPRGIENRNLYFLKPIEGGIDPSTQKRYAQQIARGFISYLMSKTGYNIDGGWNGKFAPEDREFKRK